MIEGTSIQRGKFVKEGKVSKNMWGQVSIKQGDVESAPRGSTK